MSRERAVAQLRAILQREKRPPAPPPPEGKQASVYAFRTFTWILSHAVYRGAYGDPKGYNRFHPADMSEEAVGAAAREALNASRFIAPGHPEWHALMRFPTKEEDKAADDRLKAQAGVKTIKALYSGAATVSLRQQHGAITVVPARYRGSGHWEGIRRADQDRGIGNRRRVRGGRPRGTGDQPRGITDPPQQHPGKGWGRCDRLS